MIPPCPEGSVVVLSGAGLSAASGIPTFRGPGGLWEGHRVEDVATPEAWRRNPALVRRFYDQRRRACARARPNAAHDALARLQRAWGADRVVLVTQNIDGLLGRAGAAEVIEMHGSLWRLCCAADRDHPRPPVAGRQDPTSTCESCGASLRPDVVWFGEPPYDLDRIHRETARCAVFIAVGTSGVVYPAAGLVAVARSAGAYCIEVNPIPTTAAFDHVIAAPAEAALPTLVEAWLDAGGTVA